MKAKFNKVKKYQSIHNHQIISKFDILEERICVKFVINVLAKYTCPKCELKTCSLNCTKKHKQIKQCSGEKDPTEYISKQQIDQKIVEKDYNFIEQMISQTDKVKKCLTGVNNTITLQPRRFKILRNNAKQMYNIKVVNGPNILERHRENISFFYVKNKSIYWVWQLIYVEKITQDMKNYRQTLTSDSLITQPISDQKRFIDVLSETYLNKKLLENNDINTTKRQQFCIFLENRQKMINYQESKPNNIIFNIELNNKSSNSNSFTSFFQLIEFDIYSIVNEELKNISVFQFPTLYVVHKSMRDNFILAYKNNKQKTLEDPKVNHNKQRRQKNRNRQRQRSREKKKKNQQILKDQSLECAQFQ